MCGRVGESFHGIYLQMGHGAEMLFTAIFQERDILVFAFPENCIFSWSAFEHGRIAKRGLL
jgi:hypothetical protein